MTWLYEHPKYRTLRFAAADLNGQARGKRAPRSYGEKVEKGGMRFPLSVINLDMWGADIVDSPLVFETGDADGLMRPTERGYVPMPWLDAPTALLPLWSFNENGTAFAGDPRHALAAVVDRFAQRGLTPVVATEMEFYLLDDSGTELRAPRSPISGKRRRGEHILSLRTLDAFDAFFNELYDACEAMDIPAETAISESGEGQFEVTLGHVPNALKAADDAWLFKLLTKGLARKHGLAASFMAKPYPEDSGTGLHTHFSMLDQSGENVFNDGTPQGSDTLKHAIAGCLAGMPDLMLAFAPHGSSYDRLVPGSHAPTAICWAYENRTASVRVPGGAPVARRIEHRLAGGDVNPYLFLSAVLGSALIGIEDALTPPAPITGNAYDQDLPQVPTDWDSAMARFQSSPIAARIFTPMLIDNFIRTKRQEQRVLAGLSAEDALHHYLDLV